MQVQEQVDAPVSWDIAELARRKRSGSPSHSPLAVALAEQDAARASGDGARIAAADDALDRLVDEGRAAAREAARTPSFGGGARPFPQGYGEDFTDTIRAATGRR